MLCIISVTSISNPDLGWSFNEVSGTNASCIFGLNQCYNATGVNSPRFSTGKLGNGALFNFSAKSQFVTNSDLGLNDSKANWSVCGWVNHSSSTSLIRAMLSNNELDGTGHINLLAVNPGASDSPSFRVGSVTIENTSIAIDDGLWHRVCYVKNLTINTITLYLYVDGTFYLKNDGLNSSVGSFPFVIGAGGYFSEGYPTWDGMIDEIDIWYSSLTGTDITTDYNGGVGTEYVTDNILPYFSNNLTNDTTLYIGDSIRFNITITDTNADSCRFYWNWSGTFINDTSSTYTTAVPVSTTKSINVSMAHKNICWGYWANDTLGNVNVSSVNCFDVLNSVPTTPSLISPLDLSSTDSNYAVLKYNSTDADSDTIIFYIHNSSNNVNFSLLYNGTGFSASSYNWSGLNDGSYYWKVKAGDGLDNSSNSSAYKFTVQTTAPAINLNRPANNLWLNNQTVLFNFTATDSGGVIACELWGNFSGNWLKNYTFSAVTSGTYNVTSLVLADEHTYKWNVNCSDGTNSGFSPNNYTLSVDSINPNVTLSQPTGTKTSMTDIPATWAITEYSPETCIYNVYQGINLEVPNTSVNCLLNTTTFNVTSGGVVSYTFNFYSNDSAGNIDIDSIAFTVNTISIPPSPGGGGGGSITPALACTKNSECEKYGLKYYCIQKYCIYQDVEAVCNFNGACESERGETVWNCNDKLENNTIVKQGDCTNIFKDWGPKGDLVWWVVFIIFVGGTIWLSQSKPNSFTRRTFKKVK